MAVTEQVMRSLGLLTTVLLGSLAVIAIGYAASSWSLHRRLEAAAAVVSNKAAKGDRLDGARMLSIAECWGDSARQPSGAACPVLWR